MKHNKQPIAETHASNFCLDCKSANEPTQNECQKCGSRRHRAYLKKEEMVKK